MSVTYDLLTCFLTFQDIFITNGVWSIHNVTAARHEVEYACCDHPYIQIIFTLILERSYTFYVLNIVLPSGLLAFLNCLVFLLPPDSGERLQFAVANLLAVILFQQLVGGIMPPLGDELPLLGKADAWLSVADPWVFPLQYQKAGYPCDILFCALLSPPPPLENPAWIHSRGTVKAPEFGTLNSAISNFQTWFVRTVMPVLKYCWM